MLTALNLSTRQYTQAKKKKSLLQYFLSVLIIWSHDCTNMNCLGIPIYDVFTDIINTFTEDQLICIDKTSPAIAVRLHTGANIQRNWKSQHGMAESGWQLFAHNETKWLILNLCRNWHPRQALQKHSRHLLWFKCRNRSWYTNVTVFSVLFP